MGEWGSPGRVSEVYSAVKGENCLDRFGNVEALRLLARFVGVLRWVLTRLKAKCPPDDVPNAAMLSKSAR